MHPNWLGGLQQRNKCNQWMGPVPSPLGLCGSSGHPAVKLLCPTFDFCNDTGYTALYEGHGWTTPGTNHVIDLLVLLFTMFLIVCTYDDEDDDDVLSVDSRQVVCSAPDRRSPLPMLSTPIFLVKEQKIGNHDKALRSGNFATIVIVSNKVYFF